MLQEIELGLIDHIKNSVLGKKLRQVAALPDLDGASLVKAFATDAPGVYVATDTQQVENTELILKYSVAAVVRNSRNSIAPRHGDTKALGLFQLVEALLPLLYAAKMGDEAVLYPTRVNWVKDKVLYDNGLEVAEISLEARVTMPNGLVEGDLDDFLTFNGQYDIEPLVSTAEHEKWAQEPPNHTTTAPELTDTLNVQE